MADTHTDKHTVFITGLASTTSNQLNVAIENYVRAYSKKLNKPRDFWGNWYTNLIGNGVAYVFFDKTETFYIMLGKNVDGERFYTEEPNPEYLEWKEKEDDYLKAPLNFSSSLAWSDLSDIPPPETIRTYTDKRLIEFPTIKFDSNQKRVSGVDGVDVDIKPCVVYEPGPEYDASTLFACGVSSDITEADLISFFKRFVTSSVYREPKVTLVRQRSANINDGFKKVGKNKKEVYTNKVFVKFDRNTTDAIFAYYMVRKCVIKGQGIVFRYSRLSNPRDRFIAKNEDLIETAMTNMYLGK